VSQYNILVTLALLLTKVYISARDRRFYQLPTSLVVPSKAGSGPIPLADIPLNVHFLDSYSLIGVYSTKALYVPNPIGSPVWEYYSYNICYSIFCTTPPFDPVGNVPSAEGESSMYVYLQLLSLFSTDTLSSGCLPPYHQINSSLWLATRQPLSWIGIRLARRGTYLAIM